MNNTIVKVAGSMKENTIKYGKPSIPQTHLLHGYETELPKLLKENTSYKLRQINSTDFVT